MNTFYKYNCPGIFGLVLGQKIALFATSNILTFLARIIKDNRQYENWELVVIETFSSYDILEAQLSLRGVYDKYRNSGYEIINENKRLVKFSIKLITIEDKVCVYLTNRYRKRLVGTFETMEQAQTFVDKHYQPGYTKIYEQSE